MKKWTTKMIVEAGIMLALSVILSRIKVYEAPMGGSVTAGSMIPIMLFSLRWGVGPGIVTGITFGILKIILGAWYYSPIQVILEYPIAFGFLGLAGIFTSLGKSKTNYTHAISGTGLAVMGRFICHFTAGMIFFREYAGSRNPWIYSLLYQVQYLLPEFIVSAAILSLLWKPMSRLEI